MSEAINIKNLSKPKKEVVAKILKDDDWTYEKIGRVLGVSDDSAKRYAERYKAIDSPDSLREFEIKFRAYAKTKEFEGYNLILDRMLDLIPKERRLDQLVRAGEFLSGKKEQVQTNVQVNNFIPLLGGDSAKDVSKNSGDRKDTTTTQED